MRDLYPASWKDLYFQTVLESDKEKLTGLVQGTEQAIVLRAQKLLNSTDHYKERSDMAVAYASLLSIKTNKLAWRLAVSVSEWAGQFPTTALTGRDDARALRSD